jgi:hypothetical protein
MGEGLRPCVGISVTQATFKSPSGSQLHDVHAPRPMILCQEELHVEWLLYRRIPWTKTYGLPRERRRLGRSAASRKALSGATVPFGDPVAGSH